MLTRHDARQAERDTAHIHISEVSKSDWCPRATWFRATGVEESNPDIKGFRMQSILTNGHEVHDKWQRWFWEMGVLYGKWECLVCTHTWYALSPSSCPQCTTGSETIIYREMPIYSPEYHVVSHSDGAIHDDRGAVLLEIKGLGVETLRYEMPSLYRRYSKKELTLNEVWREITQPLPAHLRQGLLYCWLLEYPQIVFLYEWKPNQDVKEFVVKFRRSLIEDLIERIEATARAIRREVPPLRTREASDPNAKLCRYCVYKDECWG